MTITKPKPCSRRWGVRWQWPSPSTRAVPTCHPPRARCRGAYDGRSVCHSERTRLAKGGAESPMIAIVDYGMGNLRSVEKALEHVGATAKIASDAETIRAADGLILPGVGAFPEAMAGMRSLGLDELIEESRVAGVPLLGICLGLQLLVYSTTE